MSVGYILHYTFTAGGMTIQEQEEFVADNNSDAATEVTRRLNALPSTPSNILIFRVGMEFDRGGTLVDSLVIPSGTSDPDTEEGSLFLRTDLDTNGRLQIYANGGWRTVAAL